jgi:hypothetical protein
VHEAASRLRALVQPRKAAPGSNYGQPLLLQPVVKSPLCCVEKLAFSAKLPVPELSRTAATPPSLSTNPY